MMSKIKRTATKLFALSALSVILSPAFAASNFTVQNVVVKGNKRLSSGTIFSYIPIHPGQTFTDAEGDATIQALFKTGYFKNVNLQRVGNTLVVDVTERPTIGLLKIEGNKEIKTKQLYKVLKHMHLVEGDVYDSTKLQQIKLGLENEYSRLGHYVAIVNTYVKKEPRNQVALTIQVTEGPLSKVHSITFTGNKHFSQRQLRDTFQLTTPGIFTIFNHHDRFSNTQLDTDLQALKNYYFDHGYLRFHVVSKNVTFNPTHTKVDIHVTVSEGPVYHISGWRVNEHDRYAHKIESMIPLKKGDTFSRKVIVATNKRIANYFANRGYAFPSIQPIPELNNTNNTVYITFNVNIGARIYVRNINIAGNTRTTGRVIRNQLRQMEESVYSRGKILESTRNIQAGMPYLTNVSETPVPVAGHPDQVDLDYNVKEVNAGKASLQGGYSDVEGFIYGANLMEPNFMGSGKFVSLGFTRSKFSSNYNFTYENPFYTIDGISRGFNVSYVHTTPGKINLESYTMNDFGVSFNYGIPISEYNSWSFGAGYDYINITNVDTTSISPAVTQFLDKHPPAYNQLTGNLGFTHQSLDRAIFPNAGSLQQLALTVGPPLGKSSLGYYKATYNGKWYFPFGSSGFVLEPHGILGYGGGLGSTGSLPFFNNFYGGGIQTLPGFSPNSLGPQNPHDTDQSMGGNLEMFAGANLFAPTFFNGKIRVGGSFNVGNIYDTHHIKSTPQIEYEDAFSNLRMSAGVLVEWWWPLGAPIDISLAFPLNKKKNDQESIFGFSMGGSL
jgi:outer membrane protein insertion porin family